MHEEVGDQIFDDAERTCSNQVREDEESILAATEWWERQKQDKSMDDRNERIQNIKLIQMRKIKTLFIRV
jgi:hypothetical protein